MGLAGGGSTDDDRRQHRRNSRPPAILEREHFRETNRQGLAGPNHPSLGDEFPAPGGRQQIDLEFDREDIGAGGRE